MRQKNDEAIFLGSALGEQRLDQVLELALCNRHGLITGATGTGKTVTLQILAEGFSAQGVPVFCADIKGDLSGLATAGTRKDFLLDRAKTIGLDDYRFESNPVIFWDIFGEGGHPIRTTISEMGPLMLSRLMQLTDAQEGVLNIAFKIADDEGLLLLDLKDLSTLLVNLYQNAKDIASEYGLVSRASIGAIQRKLLVLEQQGAEQFFGEPALNISDILRRTREGLGYIHVLDAVRLMQSPRLYASFLLWLLSELFESLPEVGDLDKPKLVFFFDEAHLLFDDAPEALVDKVEQVVRLIRSKGVGIFFVTQNPLDVPDSVSSQIGNRIQHALRAYTPREQKAVKAAASSLRPNPDLDTAQVITELGVGEALVSTLGAKGVPLMVQRTLIRPPASRLGPITDKERRELIDQSPILGVYDTPEDRLSAHEVLSKRMEKVQAEEEEASRKQAQEKQDKRRSRSTGGRVANKVTRNVLSTIGSEIATNVGRAVGGKMGGRIARSVVRGILGGIFRMR